MIKAERLARERLELDKKLDYKINADLYLRYYIPYPESSGLFRLCNDDGEILDFSIEPAKKLYAALGQLLEEEK